MKLKEAAKPVSDMKIDKVTAPEGTITKGSSFSLKGVITSNLPITKVYGGVYFRGGEETSQIAEAAPSALTYDLSSYFDKSISFGVLYDGEYTYKITAEDSSGKSYELISSDFDIHDPEKDKIAGDLNGDRELNVSDAVVLQSYLLKSSEGFTEEQYKADEVVDVFDLIDLKQAIVKASSEE